MDRKRGLPESFSLDVPESATAGPVELGDYLDEEPPPQPQVRKAPPKPRRLTTTVLRKQVNMNPETLQMVDELLEYVRTYSPQRDVRASELFYALVLSLYESRGELDVSEIPPRGRWGTPTAQAFPVGLKNAFRKAIVEDYYRKHQE